MTIPADVQRRIARFKKLPQSEDTWEGAVVAMPAWVDEPAGPVRPHGAVWVSTTRRIANIGNLEAGSGARAEDAALAAFLEMGTSSKMAGYRPRAVRVRDARLAAALRDALGDLDIEIDIVDDLPAVVTFVRELAAAAEESSVPPALDAPGVTADRLRAFAEAARQFYDAAPWRHLDDGDLIEVEAPKHGRGLSLFGVMGSFGAEFGLGFFSSVKQYRQLLADAPAETILQHGGEWAVYFGPAWDVPIADLDAWERLGLPLASDRAYPCAVRLHPDKTPQRPDAGRLAYLEGLLRALALTSEDEMDSGRWTRLVPTAEGEQTYTLTLPDLLDPPRPARSPDYRSMEPVSAAVARMMRAREFETVEEASAALETEFAGRSFDDLPSTAETPLELAQDLIYEAFEVRGRRQLQLIRRALLLSPDCADAYTLLAHRATSPAEARALYEQAVAAATRALGPDAFTDPNRSFWDDVTTRPYMRARAELAECLAAQEDLAGAVDHFRALLQLNPEDNQGIRYRLLTMLVRAHRSEEAEAVFNAYDEKTALWLYPSVLLALRANDRKLARKRLRDAMRANRRVPAYLTGQRELPDELPSSYAYGDDDEAVLVAVDLIDPWTETPDALVWLRAELRQAR